MLAFPAILLCIFVHYTFGSISVFLDAYKRHIPATDPLHALLNAYSNEFVPCESIRAVVMSAERLANIKYLSSKRRLCELYSEYVDQIVPIKFDTERYVAFCNRFSREFAVVYLDSETVSKLNEFSSVVICKMICVPFGRSGSELVFKMALLLYDLVLAVSDAHRDNVPTDQVTVFMYALQHRILAALMFQQTGHLAESPYSHINVPSKCPQSLDEGDLLRRAKEMALLPFTVRHWPAGIVERVAFLASNINYNHKAIIKSMTIYYHAFMKRIKRECKSLLDCLDLYIKQMTENEPNTGDLQVDSLLKQHLLHALFGGITKPNLHLRSAYFHLLLFKLDRINVWSLYVSAELNLEKPYNRYRPNMRLMQYSTVCSRRLNIIDTTNINCMAMPGNATGDFGITATPFYLLFAPKLQKYSSSTIRIQMMAAMCAMDAAAAIKDTARYEEAAKVLQLVDCLGLHKCVTEMSMALKKFRDAMATHYKQYPYIVSPSVAATSANALESVIVLYWYAFGQRKVFSEAFGLFKAVISAYYKFNLIPQVYDLTVKCYIYMGLQQLTK